MRFVGRGLVALVMAAPLGCSLGTDSFAPVVSITSPTTQVVRATVNFSAEVLDETGIARVRFLVDGALLVEDSEPPYTTSWDTRSVANGDHTLRVEAYDVGGNSASASRLVTVSNSPPN